MVKKSVLMALLLFLLLGTVCFAQNVEDGAMMLEDVANVEAKLEEVSRELGFPIFLITTRDRGGLSPMDYADTELVHRVGPDQNGAMMIVDFASRDLYISVSGEAFSEEKVPENVLQKMIDGVASRLSEGKIDQAALYYAKGIERMVRGNILSLFDYLMSLLGGSGVSLGFVASQRKRYNRKPVPHLFPLKQNSNLNFAVREDRMIDTQRSVSSIPRENSGSSSGGSSRHTGSDGGSFRGGGRSF